MSGFVLGRKRLGVNFGSGIVSGLDRSKVERFDPSYVGELILDEEFDMKPEASQDFFLSVYEKMDVQKFINPGSSKCWIKDFKAWLLLEDETFPVPEAEFISKVSTWIETTLEGNIATTRNEVVIIG